MKARRGWAVVVIALLLGAVMTVAAAWQGLRTHFGEDEEWLFWSDVPAGDPPRWSSSAWPDELSMFGDAAFRAALAEDRFDAPWEGDRIKWATGGRGAGLLGESETVGLRRESQDTGQGTNWSIERRLVGWPTRWLRQDEAHQTQGSRPLVGRERSVDPGEALASWATWTAMFLGIWAAWRLSIAANRRRRQRKGLCPMCRYHLGEAVKAGCPECGWRRPE